MYSDEVWNWRVPGIAGRYALACQVNPDITAEQFGAAALKTGETVRLCQDEEEVDLGPTANPAALIERLQRNRQP